MWMKWDNKRILLEAAVIFSLGVIIGLSVNYRMVMNAFSGEVVTSPVAQETSSEMPAYPVPVTLDGVRKELENDAVIIDARASELYREAHIPGALSVPLGELEEKLSQLKDSIPPTQTIITYCSGYGCPDSFDLGVRLLEEGYQDVQVFEGGLPEWEDRGLPVQKDRT